MKNYVLELDEVRHSYGDHEVVKGLTLKLDRGKIGCLLGESGCGKTTVLRAIAGFETIREGTIRIDGKFVSGPELVVAPHRRDVGMVFQDYALFPHLTVAANVGFGLGDLERAARRERVSEVLATVGLDKAAGKYPHELSGGQQQRVALARALAPKPGLLLLDEPFSNLDVTLRERLSLEVRDILKEYGATALLVTHNQAEAFAMADEIGVMRDGRLEQWAESFSLYHEPANRYVAGFVGEGVLIPSEPLGDGRARTALGDFGNPGEHPPGEMAVLLRPEDVIHDDESPTRAQVLKRTFRGSNLLYLLRLGNGQEVQAMVPSRCDHKEGEWIGIRTDLEHVILL